MPSGTPKDQIEIHANEVLRSLGLESIKNNIVGSVEYRGISGGEKRRCSIGVELMAKQKQILFLDEPTSGLDTSSSKLVIETLKALTIDRKLTVVCTLHQPRRRIFDILDNLILLCKGGNIIYDGKSNNAGVYFSQWFQNDEYENIADWLVDISTQNLAPFRLAQMCTVCGVSERYAESTPNIIIDQILPQLWEKKGRFSKQLHIDENIDKRRICYSDPSFFRQVQYQFQRSLLGYKRTWIEKTIEFLCICIGTVFVSIIEGETVLVDGRASHNVTFNVMGLHDSEDLISENDLLWIKRIAIAPILRSLE